MNKKIQGRSVKILGVCLLAALLLTACSPGGKDPNGNSPMTSETKDRDQGAKLSNEDTARQNPAEEALERRVREKLSGMTLKEKAAQIFVITPEALTGYKTVTAAAGATQNALKTYPVGGLVYFGANIVTPHQLKTMTKNTQQYAREIEGMPLFLAIDEEGGSVSRIANNKNFAVKKYADMATVGASGDPKKAYEVGAAIGGYLHEYGLNLDFAPTADAFTNPANTAIGKRSFGADGNFVAKMSLEVAKGLADNRVFSCFKHFPGHGATEGDTHAGFAYTNKTLGELNKNELIPFQAAADNAIPFIMISHISAPGIIGDDTPSSLSKIMITDILRNQMGYDGIIITDSMSMGAIVNAYGTKEAVIRSIQAGADLILMPRDFKEAYQGVLEAVADGTVPERRINESLERILRIKLNM